MNDTEIRFRPGQTVLNDKAKDALDQIAAQVRGQRGYIVEVKGFSHAGGQAGIRNSQHMADAVVRYLASHDVPVYRIYRVALGNASVSNDSDSNPRGSVVHRECSAKQFSGLEHFVFGREFTDWSDAVVFRAALPSGCCVATNG